MLRRSRDAIDVVYDICEVACLLHFLKTEGRLDLERDFENEACGSETADGGIEKIGTFRR